MLTKVDMGLDELDVHRYWCECTDPRHALEISLDHETRTCQVSIISPKYTSFRQRVTNAFRVLFGKQVQWMEVLVRWEDRNKLADTFFNLD